MNDDEPYPYPDADQLSEPETQARRAVEPSESARAPMLQDEQIIIETKKDGLLACPSPLGRSYFSLRGLIDGMTVAATLGPGGLLAHDELLQRAQVVVQMGEEFERENGTRLAASLDGPIIAVALTLLRACDRPLEFHLGLGRSL